MASHSSTQKPQRWKTYVTIFTLAALVVSVYALRQQILQVFDDLGKVNVWALALMPFVQLLNYHSYAKMYQYLYHSLGETVEYRKLMRLQSELVFVNHVFPSGGVTGISYFGLRMREQGVSAGKSTLIQVMKFGLLFISYEVLLLFGLFSLALLGRTNNFLILVLASLATMMVILTLGGMFILASERRVNVFLSYITQRLNRLIHFVRPKHPETIDVAKVEKLFNELHHNYVFLRQNYRQLKWPLIYALLANATEVASVYLVYVAFGHFVNIGAVILAYAVANFAGLVSVLPGGLGIYEGLMTATLAAAGVRPALSIPVTVMFRVLSTLMQVPLGYFFYHKALHRKVPEPEPVEKTVQEAAAEAEAQEK